MDQRGSQRSASEFQRRHIRHTADLPIHVNASWGEHHEMEDGRMVDVSEGGLCFIGARYLPPETAVDIEFEGCRLTGHVRTCRIREYAAHVQFVTGVQIEQLVRGSQLWTNMTQGIR